MDPSSFRIKIKGPNNVSHVLTLPRKITLNDLQKQLSDKFRIRQELQEILAPGYPNGQLSSIDLTNLSRLVTDFGIRNGDCIIVREVLDNKEIQQGHGMIWLKRVTQTDGGHPEVKTMPGDNSCLFSAINYIVNYPSLGTQGQPDIRNIIISEVTSNPSKYTTAVLGRSNRLYAEMIGDTTAWGGATDIQILAEHYEIEIVSLDEESLTEIVFGANKGYMKRGFILYRGRQHYDALTYIVGSAEMVVFSPNDKIIVEKMHSLVESLFKSATGQDGVPKWDSGSKASDITFKQGHSLHDNSWSCKQCTFLNKDGDDRCTICDFPRRPVY